MLMLCSFGLEVCSDSFGWKGCRLLVFPDFFVILCKGLDRLCLTHRDWTNGLVNTDKSWLSVISVSNTRFFNLGQPQPEHKMIQLIEVPSS